MPSGPGDVVLEVSRISLTVSIVGRSGFISFGRFLVYVPRYLARSLALAVLGLLLQISPPQYFLAIRVCFLGQVVGGSDGLVRSEWIWLEDEGRRGAMWSVGHLPLIAELRKIASPSDLSSSVL